MRYLLFFFLTTVVPCEADVCFDNTSTNNMLVGGSFNLLVPPLSNISLNVNSSQTNGITINGTSFPFADGDLFVLNPDSTINSEAVLRSAYDDDSQLSWYFINGLELGTGTAAVLAGWYAVKRGLTLGDLWKD